MGVEIVGRETTLLKDCPKLFCEIVPCKPLSGWSIILMSSLLENHATHDQLFEFVHKAFKCHLCF